ncbi:hypothetical protein BC936DRAFT_143146 [Jimgerdemannia flammicorona]|uniref:Uncharacterized protein n=1 Tax=Jimgerdemannia flammicorona TaxID=994334 RepID=A0A432ZZC3_9FUNG|nr:hypothetical protein BC936DRAFT_143146 [Jimgerdemannia flammicorona]
MPKVRATAVADSLQVQAAKFAPKVNAEGLHKQTVASAPLRGTCLFTSTPLRRKLS